MAWWDSAEDPHGYLCGPGCPCETEGKAQCAQCQGFDLNQDVEPDEHGPFLCNQCKEDPMGTIGVVASTPAVTEAHLVIDDAIGGRLLEIASVEGGLMIQAGVAQRAVFLNQKHSAMLFEFVRQLARRDAARAMPFGWGNQQHLNWIAEEHEESGSLTLTLYKPSGEIHRRAIGVHDGNPGGLLLRFLREL